MNKRMGSILLAAVLALSFTACSSTDTTESWAGATEDAYVTAPENVEPEGYYEGEASYTEAVDEDEWYYEPPFTGGEEYTETIESGFISTATQPLSTFSSDVDTASYSNMRRQLRQGLRPEGIRIEELVNYFDYGYDKPKAGSDVPFSVSAEVAECPWNPEHQLAMIGVQGKALESTSEISNNIVFLIDVSGSMDSANKLPLLKESFIMMLEKLDSKDRISIVTYASGTAVVADSIPGNKTRELTKIINKLSAGGSTAGAAGIQLAYDLAEENFIQNGNNRVILATDGDFNVGISSSSELEEFITEKRESGVFLSVLGYGMGNYKDNKMETLADCGNGNYAYIDTLQEAKKVLVDEFDSTMFTIAQDLKLQVEFNPEVVAQYRLVGYDNRRLEDRDFNDDTKDAGDVGAGHSVTAFYELILVGSESESGVDDLKYSRTTTGSNDYMTVKIRHKEPGESQSVLNSYVIDASRYNKNPSEAFAFASAVAEFGLILTDSEYRAGASMAAVEQRTQENLGADPYGLRAEFYELVGLYRDLID